jgi:hypothetical protein
MKQPGVILTLLVFIVAVSFVLFAQQKEGARPLTAKLTGTGDVDGSGTAKIQLNAGQSQLCYELAVSNIGEPKSIAILSSAKVRIATFGINSGSQCAVIERDKLMDLARNPTAYIISIQNSEYPNGAIQGQLIR